jgi:uncharacterized protein HemY
MNAQWARLLKQQLLITVDRLPTKETNFRFPFPFAANKRKVAVAVFLLVPFSVYRIPETWRHIKPWRHGDMRHRDMEMETWKHGDIDMRHGKWGNGDMEIWRHGDMET